MLGHSLVVLSDTGMLLPGGSPSGLHHGICRPGDPGRDVDLAGLGGGLCAAWGRPYSGAAPGRPGHGRRSPRHATWLTLADAQERQ